LDVPWDAVGHGMRSEPPGKPADPRRRVLAMPRCAAAARRETVRVVQGVLQQAPRGPARPKRRRLALQRTETAVAENQVVDLVPLVLPPAQGRPADPGRRVLEMQRAETATRGAQIHLAPQLRQQAPRGRATPAGRVRRCSGPKPPHGVRPFAWYRGCDMKHVEGMRNNKGRGFFRCGGSRPPRGVKPWHWFLGCDASHKEGQMTPDGGMWRCDHRSFRWMPSGAPQQEQVQEESMPPPQSSYATERK